MKNIELTKEDIERFNALYSKNKNGCFVWKNKLSKGYGSFYKNRIGYRAHRVSFTISKGSIANGMIIEHLCRNRACVNPLHLRQMTDRENIIRGRGEAANNIRKTHCPKGHEYNTENTGFRRKDPNGIGRVCKACDRIKSQKRRRILTDRKLVS